MAKTRARKKGTREPNGRISRAEARQMEIAAPATVVRLRNAALAGMADQRWATVLGRMNLEGRITSAQFEAGRWFSRLRSMALAAIDHREPRAASLERLGASHEPDPDSTEGQAQATRDRHYVTLYEAAREKLSKGGPGVERETVALCNGVGEWPPGLAATNAAIAGLNILCEMCGVGKRK